MKSICYGQSQILHPLIGRNVAVSNWQERNQIIPVFVTATDTRLRHAVSAQFGVPSGSAKAGTAAGEPSGRLRAT